MGLEPVSHLAEGSVSVLSQHDWYLWPCLLLWCQNQAPSLHTRTRLGYALGMLNLGAALHLCYRPTTLNHALPCHAVWGTADWAAGKSLLQSLQAEESAQLRASISGKGL